jgi:anaerobic selenocysteine-containing dehydrogenase
MSDLSRRDFIKRGSLGVAAGVAAAGIGADAALAGRVARGAKEPGTHAAATTADEPIVAYVRRGSRGEVSLMVGGSEIVRKDADLARRIIRASKR